MDNFKRIIQAHLTEAQGLAPNLPAAQLQQKVRKINTEFDAATRTAPSSVKDIIVNGLTSIGWDCVCKVRNTNANPALFTQPNLVQALEKIRDDINNWSPNLNPTQAELDNLSLACNRLWELDIHRLTPERDYSINVQGGKYVSDDYDAAAEPLFRFVDEAALRIPTYAAFIALLDNYTAETGSAELVSREEREENSRFLNLIMDTKPMRYVHQYLVSKHKTQATTREAFIAELNTLWFGLYKRKVQNDSSAFEHVFLGEIQREKNEVSGFHNWIQLYLEERRGTFDYRGYIKPRRRGHSSAAPHSHEQLVTLSFAWKGYLKKVSSSFLGTSPEFEMALYTLCYYMGQQENVVQCGPYKVLVTVYTFPDNPRPGQRVFLSSSFPGEAPLDEDEAARRIQSSARSKFVAKK